MGPAKAALEATSRYLARYLGTRDVRCNLVSAGPIKSMAAKSIPGFDQLADTWNERSPLSWNVMDPEPAARGVVALLSEELIPRAGEWWERHQARRAPAEDKSTPGSCRAARVWPPRLCRGDPEPGAGRAGA